MRQFSHESLPVVVLRASPLRIEKFSESLGQGTESEGGIARARSCGFRVKWNSFSLSSPVNAISVKVWRGNGIIGLAAPRKWVVFHGSVLGAVFSTLTLSRIQPPPPTGPIPPVSAF